MSKSPKDTQHTPSAAISIPAPRKHIRTTPAGGIFEMSLLTGGDLHAPNTPITYPVPVAAPANVVPTSRLQVHTSPTYAPLVAQHISPAAAQTPQRAAQFGFNSAAPSSTTHSPIHTPSRVSLLTEALQRRGIGQPALPSPQGSPDPRLPSSYHSTPPMTASGELRAFNEAFTPSPLQLQPVVGSHTRQLSEEKTKAAPSSVPER